MNERACFIDIIRGLISHTATCTLPHEKGLKIQVNLDVEIDEKISWKASFLSSSDNVTEKPNIPKPSPRTISKKYPCLLCPATFKYSSNLRRHESHQHNRSVKRRGQTKVSEFKSKAKENGNKRNQDKTMENKKKEINSPTLVSNSNSSIDLNDASENNVIDVQRIIDALQNHTSKTRNESMDNGCAEVFTLEDDVSDLNLSNEEDISETKSFPCPVCPINFNRTSNLYRHIRTQHPDQQSFIPQQKNVEKIFKCPFCLKSFTFRTNMRRHIRKTHPDKKAWKIK